MNDLTRESVATMTGPALDAAVHERFFGRAIDFPVQGWKVHGLPKSWAYSEGFAHLGDILAELESRGWNWNFDKQKNRDHVTAFLSKREIGPRPATPDTPKPRSVEAEGETLPQAVCRAAVMTTITEDES